MPAADFAARAAAQLDAEYTGAGLWGLLFRVPRRPRYLRLIPNDELGADQRAELGEWPTRPRRPGLAPVVAADQREIGGRWFQVVTYETRAERSLADALADADPRVRLHAAAAALRTLPEWWDGIGPGLAPLPSDIVFDDGRPVLLPLPAWGVPSIGEVLAEPERIAHLSPEAVRGGGRLDRADDVYAVAMAALRCFDDLPDAPPETLLQAAACGDLASPPRCSNRLPPWMSRTDPVGGALADLRALIGAGTAARAAADTASAAGSLRRARRAMDPLSALETLRDKGEHRRAVDLAHVVLLESPGYEVMMLAAAIAHEDLHAPFEALSLLERAVRTEPGRPDAYLAQLSVVLDGSASVSARLAAIDGSFAERLDTTVLGAFDRLPEPDRRDRAHAVTRYLIDRGDLVGANAFAHRCLNEGGTYRWWEFELMLDFADTFLLSGRTEEAGHVAAEVKQGLRRVREERRMSPAAIRPHGERLTALEVRLHSARLDPKGTEDSR